MMGNWISDFFGKPQSWYDRVDRDQKALSMRSAEVAALGQDAWESVRSSYLSTVSGPEIDFLSFSEINDGIIRSLRSLVITPSHTPSDQDIESAEAFNTQYGRYVDYVKQMVPELAAQADADAENVRRMLAANSMRSPAEAGVQEFEDEIARRAKILGSGIGAAALLYFGVPILLLMMMGRGRG